MDPRAFQDEAYFQGNHCFGCGPDNAAGLRMKSYWDGDEGVCSYRPEPHQCAGWPHVTYGGLIASLIDCHTVCTVIAAYNRDAAPDEVGRHWFASVSLKVDYLAPTPIDRPLALWARIREMGEKKALVSCSVYSGDQETARGEVVAVRVPAGGGPGARP